MKKLSLCVGGGWVSKLDHKAILQIETCQILSVIENSRWSRVWQQGYAKTSKTRMKQAELGPAQLQLELGFTLIRYGALY